MSVLSAYIHKKKNAETEIRLTDFIVMNIRFVLEEMTSLSDNISQLVLGESPRYIYALNRAEFIHHKTVFSKDTTAQN